VGSYNELLPYLVRRLPRTARILHSCTRSPTRRAASSAHRRSARRAARALHTRSAHSATAQPLSRPPQLLGLDLAGNPFSRTFTPESCPTGKHGLPAIALTSLDVLDSAIAHAAKAFESWSRVPVAERAAVLERAADALEERMVDLVSLIVREGKRTYSDAVSEVREARRFLPLLRLASSQ